MLLDLLAILRIAGRSSFCILWWRVSILNGKHGCTWMTSQKEVHQRSLLATLHGARCALDTFSRSSMLRKLMFAPSKWQAQSALKEANKKYTSWE